MEELEDARLVGFDFIGGLAERAAFFRLVVALAVSVRRLVFRFAIVLCPFEP